VSVLAHFGYLLLASSAILPLLSAFKRRDPGVENAQIRRVLAHMVDSRRIGIAFSGGASPSEIVDCVRLAESLGMSRHG
jgi:hypothetical protein